MAEHLVIKQSQLITINTDASFYHDTLSAGWATWIRYRGEKITYSGPLLTATTSLDAEKMAIINALYLVKKQGWEFEKIIVNTDCMSAIAHLTNRLPHDILSAIASEKISFLDKVEYRHVRAHTHTRVSRNWVNDWCDKEAKKHSRKLHKKRLKNGKISNSKRARR